MKRHLVLTLVALVILTTALVPVAHAESQGAVFTVVSLVYEDQNADGAYGLSLAGVEPGIANVAVSIYLDNAPLNVLGPEDKLLETQSTNTEGYVIFGNVPHGAYILRTTVVTNLIATTPSVQPLTLTGEAHGAALEWLFGWAPRSQMPVRAFMPMVGR
ncbi:MAG: hypothetical protein NT169_17700 [Chloroflexi bacterium]|nr:hypothetical protein [Chloroflexota bacterium]